MVTDPAEPAGLRTGALSAVIRDGDLFDVRVGQVTVLDRVYLAVRDRDWGTVPRRLLDYRVRVSGDAFQVSYTAVHTSPAVSFRYEVRIDGGDGRIGFAMDGAAEREFLGNRVGFCLLHPQDLAGAPVTVTTPDGALSGAFPVRVAPDTPFAEMTGMAYRDLEIAFAGELFETEDQRNWTDASFKTFCTPMRLPYPRLFTPVDRVRQTVTLTGRGTAAAPTAAASAPGVVVLGGPADGVLPELGFGLPAQGGPLDPEGAALVRALRPGHLRAELHTGGDWRATLDRAVRDRGDAPLDLELVCPDETGLADLVDALAELGDGAIRRIHAYDAAAHTTTAPLARRLRDLLDRHGLRMPVGGGSRANLAELNRAELPLDALDFVTYSISPQVHAFDDASMMDTLRAQPITLDTAAEIGAGRPVVVGPMTLLPRFNPVATGEPAVLGLAGLPAEVDPRQAGSFTAAWTVGSIAGLRRAQALTYYETVGWRGLFARRDEALAHAAFPARPGELFPVYAVFRELAEVAGGPLYEVTAGPGLAALAVRRGERVRLIVANLSDRPRTVGVAGVREAATRLLGRGPVPDPVTLALPGYGVAVVDGRPAARTGG